MVGTFHISVFPVSVSRSTKSVNVPPISKAISIMLARSTPSLASARLRSSNVVVGSIQRPAQPRAQFHHLVLGDDQRRREGDAVAGNSQDQPIASRVSIDARAQADLGW